MLQTTPLELVPGSPGTSPQPATCAFHMAVYTAAHAGLLRRGRTLRVTLALILLHLLRAEEYPPAGDVARFLVAALNPPKGWGQAQDLMVDGVLADVIGERSGASQRGLGSLIRSGFTRFASIEVAIRNKRICDTFPLKAQAVVDNYWRAFASVDIAEPILRRVQPGTWSAHVTPWGGG